MYSSIVPWTRHVFIDCGGNNGSSVRKFRKEYDRRARFEIFTFEPNGIYSKNYTGVDRHKLIPAAVHNHDGHTEFFLDREDGDGSTLFKQKLTRDNGGFGVLDTERPEIVETVDLSRWIRENTSQRDYLILKLDVEGAEYDIIEKLAEDNHLNRIRHLFVEWHWMKIGVSESRHRECVTLLQRARIKVEEWDAFGY